MGRVLAQFIGKKIIGNRTWKVRDKVFPINLPSPVILINQDASLTHTSGIINDMHKNCLIRMNGENVLCNFCVRKYVKIWKYVLMFLTTHLIIVPPIYTSNDVLLPIHFVVQSPLNDNIRMFLLNSFYLLHFKIFLCS